MINGRWSLSAAPLPQTSYDGQTITYDAIGNPISYRGATLTWNGRQLASYTKGDLTITYKYDANGLRTSKTVNGVEYTYGYENGKLVYERKGNEYEVIYRYDADGNLFTVSRHIFSSGYESLLYAVNNTRGDVVALYKGGGGRYSTYTYDSWGKPVVEATEMSAENSVRYRGYVYDQETGLYYLQSRYYDPETGRFLNADDVDYIGYSGEDISYNAFAYCDNEPICGCDPFGLYKIKTFSQQTWLTRLVGKLYGGNIGYKTIIFQMKNDNAKLALDLVLEKITNPNAAYRHSIVYAKDGVDIDFSIGGVDFDLVGGSASYTYTKKVELTSVGIVYKWAKDTVGFGTSFAQALPYDRERSTVSITLRLMLEVTYKYIKKSLLKIVIKDMIRLLLPVAQEACNVLYSLYKGTAKLNKLVPAMVKTLSKAY